MSRPSRALFPLDDFRASCEAVLSRPDLGAILQLGSPSGYEPLRRHLMDEARRQSLARPGDDLIITNGCQQALDLIGRVLLRPGDTVAVEDPVYTGLKNLLTGMGAQLVGIPVGAEGMDTAHLERVLERERPRFLVVTSNFQNPTGATLSLAARRALLDAAGAAGVPVVENDAYGEFAIPGRALARPQTIGRARRHGAAAQFLQSEFSGTAGGLGGGSQAADRPPAARQGIGRPAYRSAFAGGAARVRAIRPPGSAPRAHVAAPAPNAWRPRWIPAAGISPPARVGPSRRAA